MLLEFESKIANMEESCPDRESYEVYYIPFYINYIFIIEWNCPIERKDKKISSTL